MKFTEFTIRTEKPTKENKHYVTRSSGGWSTCVKGKPDYECDVLSNCVGYCCGRFNEIYSELTGYNGQKYPYFNCNAENFIERSKEYYPELEIGDEPRPGAIMVWQKGETLSSKDGCGHVAMVEKIIDENTIMTSESSWGSEIFFWTRTRSKGDGNWQYEGKLRGYIYNPAVKVIEENKPPVRNLKFKKDDIVNFVGCFCWDDPNGKVVNVSRITEKLKIIDTCPAGIHPYLLESVGWVNENDIEEYVPDTPDPVIDPKDIENNDEEKDVKDPDDNNGDSENEDNKFISFIKNILALIKNIVEKIHDLIFSDN